MTKTLVFLFCGFLTLIVALESSATHLIGGEMSYEYIGDGDYMIRLKVYRDCGPDNTMGTDFDVLAAVGVFENGVLIQTLLMTSANAEISVIPNDVADPCLNIPSDLCNEQAVYMETLNLGFNLSGYDIVYQRCCRSPSIANLIMPGNQGATYWVHIPGSNEVAEQNSSPTFTNLPPSLLCAGSPFSMNHSATELDGDEMIYSLCDPFLGADNINPQPNPPLAPPFLNVTWDTGFSFSNPITANPLFSIDADSGLLSGTPTDPGKYVIGICVREYRDGILICTVIRDFMFNVVLCSPEIVAAVIPQNEPCQGMTIEFGNGSFNSDDFIWDFGVDGTDDDMSFEMNPIYTFPDTGVYIVTLIAGPNEPCGDTTQLAFTIYDLVSSTITVGQPFCANGGIGFEFAGSGVFSDDATFSWDFGGETIPETSDQLEPDVIVFTASGSFNVVFTVTDGICISQAIVPIIVDPFPLAAIVPQNEFCSGLTISFVNASQFSESFLWDFGLPGTGDQSTAENPTFTYPSYGTYTVTLTVDPGTECQNTTTMEIDVSPENPIVMSYIVGNANPCGGNPFVELIFNGAGADIITWDLGDGNSADGSPIDYEYDEEGQYSLSLTVVNLLCEVEEQVFFDLYFETDIIDAPVLMPNVFTPNGDPKNQRFRPFFVNEQAILPAENTIFSYLHDYQMKIYDRWGVMMFDSDAGSSAWDGLYNNKEVSEGTYYYIVKYREQCNSTLTVLDGSFSLLNK